MPNLPVISDISLLSTINNFIASAPSDTANPTAPELTIEQTFGNILAALSENETQNNSFTKEEDINQEAKSGDPLTANTSILNDQWIIQQQLVTDASTVALHAILPKDTLLTIDQPVADELTTYTENSLLSAELLNENRNINQLVKHVALTNNLVPTIDQEIMPRHTATSIPSTITATNSDIKQPVADKPITFIENSALFSEQANGTDTNTVISPPASSLNPIADTVNFADGSKILPSSVIPGSTQTNLNPLIDTANSTYTSTITTEFGQPDWSRDFSQKITWLVNQRIQAAELKLHPAHLGPIEISLQLSSDQQLTAQFVSHHAAIRDVIEVNLPRLREILAENGITLANTSVSADTSQQQAESGQRNTFHTPGNNYFSSTSPDSTQIPTPITRVTGHRGIIDTFA